MALTMQNTAAQSELQRMQSVISCSGNFIMGSMGAKTNAGERPIVLRNPIHPHEARETLMMAQHSRLGEFSLLHLLDEALLASIAGDYEAWYHARPWDRKEALECEQLWLKGSDVNRLSHSFDRSAESIRKLLLIENTILSEDQIRDLERVIPKGHVICDVENYGGEVQRAAFCIIPSHFGVAGDGEPVCHFDQFPLRLKQRMIASHAVHDPENVLGYGELSPIMNR